MKTRDSPEYQGSASLVYTALKKSCLRQGRMVKTSTQRLSFDMFSVVLPTPHPPNPPHKYPETFPELQELYWVHFRFGVRSGLLTAALRGIICRQAMALQLWLPGQRGGVPSVFSFQHCSHLIFICERDMHTVYIKLYT